MLYFEIVGYKLPEQHNSSVIVMLDRNSHELIISLFENVRMQPDILLHNLLQGKLKRKSITLSFYFPSSSYAVLKLNYYDFHIA